MHLIPTPIPHDMLQATHDLVDGVQGGDIVGLALLVQLRHRRFFVDAFGGVLREPQSARGWLLSLDDYLRAVGAQKRGSPTTR